MDLHATEAFALAPMERRSVGTGVRIAIPPGYEGQVRPRSGLAARHGISMVNTPGTIDSDYRGEIRVLLINLGHESVSFNQGDRIAQLAIVPVARADMRVVLSLDCTDRGESGFGSTGV
jgi:dUTP pyrophosphatase